MIKKPSNNFNAGFNERWGNSSGQRRQEAYSIGKIVMGHFCIKCGAWKGELGSEPSPFLFVEHLLMIFNEVKRILKKQGVCFVNLGDTYSGSGGNNERWASPKEAHGLTKPSVTVTQKVSGIKSKSLCQIPERFSIAMCDNAGWIKRNNIIWHKNNPMPEAVKDRFTDDFEFLYFYAKDKKYYFNQQFDEYTEPLNRWGGDNVRNSSHKYIDSLESDGDNGGIGRLGATSMFRKGAQVRPNDNGRNKRCVWTINTEPYPNAHFAVFPEKLVETPIKAGCPKGGVILEPFAGSGTTLSVAKKFGRKFVGIELNKEYCDLAVKRVQQVSIPMELGI